METRILAAEQRPAVAHGETVGFMSENKSSPGRGERNLVKDCLRRFFIVPAGAFSIFCLTHGFTVGYFLSSLRDFAHFARHSPRLLLREQCSEPVNQPRRGDDPSGIRLFNHIIPVAFKFYCRSARKLAGERPNTEANTREK